jgi:hypothetical protein
LREQCRDSGGIPYQLMQFKNTIGSSEKERGNWGLMGLVIFYKGKINARIKTIDF